MALSFLSPKILRAEVTAGIDIESAILLTGDRITIGTGTGDDLILGAGDVVAEHLTLVRDEATGKWDYFTSDRGHSQISKGNPRTGTLAAGMWFMLGNDTRLDIRAVPRPAEMTEEKAKGEKSEVPLTVALPLMGLMLAVCLWIVLSMGDDPAPQSPLRTTVWFTGQAPLEPALDECLATGLEQSQESGAIRVSRAAPDALFRAHILATGDTAKADQIHAELTGKIREMLAQAHFLTGQQRHLEAAAILRRFENVLPVGIANCPILRAARYDLAVLELKGQR